MALAQLLPSTVMVQRKSRIADGQGGNPITWIDDHQEIVFIDRPTGKDVPLAYQKQGIVMFPVYAQAGAGIFLGDRLILGTRIFEVRVAQLGPPTAPYTKFLAEEYVIGR